MKILIVGSGGREHAIAIAYAKSKEVNSVFVAPGNDFMPLTNKKIKTLPEILMGDFENLLSFIKKEKVDLIDVAQDDVIAAGYVNKLKEEGFQTFGPTKEAAEIEWSKDWARNFMKKYKLPAPIFKSFSRDIEAVTYVNSLDHQLLFIKASGLALGKGVIKAENKQQAKEAILSMKQFGKAGETFLIEEGLVGEEFSLFVFCDGKNYVITKSSQDHKTIFNGDKGPNTGGIGCVSPTASVTPKLIIEIEKTIIRPTLLGLIKEGRPYMGILYLGGIVTRSASSGQAEVKIIEFNSRWGDPEAEVIIPSIKTDYLTIIQSILNQKLSKIKIKFDKKVRISVAGCANGYPTDYSKAKGKKIYGLLEATKLPGVSVYSSGISEKDGNFIVSGGRLFHLVAEGETLAEARIRVYGAMAMIYVEGNNLHYRTDIGWRDMEREYR